MRYPHLPDLNQPRLNSEYNLWEFPAFTLAEVLQGLLAPLPSTYWLIDKYLLGSHFLLTPPFDIHEQDLKALTLFQLRRMYTETYLAYSGDLHDLDNPELVHTFDNITFGQSLEGGVVLVENATPRGCPGPGHDFYRGFIDKARYHYFMPYLLALHQRFALINFAMASNHLDMNNLNTVRPLRRQVFDFVLRWRYSQISNVTMYNRVHGNWRRVLGLDLLLQEIKSEMDELDEMLERDSRVAEEQNRARWDEYIKWFNTLMLPALLLTGFFGMNIYEFTNEGPSIWDLSFWKWAIVIVVAYFICLLGFPVILKLFQRQGK